MSKYKVVDKFGNVIYTDEEGLSKIDVDRDNLWIERIEDE